MGHCTVWRTHIKENNLIKYYNYNPKPWYYKTKLLELHSKNCYKICVLQTKFNVRTPTSGKYKFVHTKCTKHLSTKIKIVLFKTRYVISFKTINKHIIK